MWTRFLSLILVGCGNAVPGDAAVSDPSEAANSISGTVSRGAGEEMEQRPAQVDLSAYADWEASASLSADGNETIREGRHPAPACLWGGGADAQVLNPNNAKESRYRASIPGYFMELSAGVQGNPYKNAKKSRANWHLFGSCCIGRQGPQPMRALAGR